MTTNTTENQDKTIFSTTHRQNISKAMKGTAKSPEHRAKLSEAAKKRWAAKREATGETS
jgi:hypothetical protein